ncbi:MAG: hypothetical protein NVS1B10_03690 [Candidatus Saccharimonadales bacterium]
MFKDIVNQIRQKPTTIEFKPENYKILAVDDEEIWRHTFSVGLERLGCRYEITDDVESATNIMKEGEINGVITDGLEGGWTNVVESAHLIGATAVVLSGSSVVVGNAERAGIMAYNKAHYKQTQIEMAVGYIIQQASSR